MTYNEYMKAIRDATAAWSDRYAERIPNSYPAGSNPHDGQTTDYAVHHAQFGAPQTYEDLLEERLAEIDARWLAPENAINRQQTTIDQQRAAARTRRGQ